MAFQVYLDNTVIVIRDTVTVKKDETLNPSLTRYWVKQDGVFYIQESTEKTIYNLGTFENIQDKNGLTFASENLTREYLNAFINLLATGIFATAIEPLAVNNDQISVNDIDWENSDFTDWVGNPRDLFGNVNNGGIYNDTANNPKSFTLRLIRTRKMRDFGIGASIGNFSNLKAVLLGSGGAERGILDASEDPEKATSWVYSQEEFSFNAIRAEFHTVDRVDVTNVFLKYTFSAKKQNNIHKFGFNPSIDTGGNETIWSLGDNYIFTTTPQNYFFSSSNALDDQLISFETIGINADGRYQREITEIALQGQTKIQIPTNFLCIAINRAFNNNGTESLGDVYIYEDGPITGGIPNDLNLVRAFIPQTFNQTRQAVYTVPEFLEDGRQVLQFDLYYFIIELVRTQNAAGAGSLFVREKGKVKREQSSAGLSDSNAAQYEFGENTPLSIPAGSDIWLQVYDVTANNCQLAGKFKGSLIIL